MSNFMPFVFLVGALFGLLALIAAWLFRTTSAHIGLKVLLPLLMVAVALYAPFQVSRMMGLPVETTVDAMPDEIQLISYWPNDRVRTVDMRTIASDTQPRAYRVALTPELKQLLEDAADIFAGGGLVFLKKQPDHAAGGVNNGGGCLSCGMNFSIRPGSTGEMPTKKY